MSDFLFYCGKCNSLISDRYDDEDIICEKCGGRTIPLHMDEDEWNEMSSEEKKELLLRVSNPIPQVQKRRPAETASRRVSNTTQQQYNQPNTKDYHDKFSGMSITGFILSFLGCIGFVGIILGIIDLTKKDGRKRGLSIAAIVIGAIMFIGSIGGFSSRSDNTEKVVETPSTVSESVETAIDDSSSNESVETTVEDPTPMVESSADSTEDTATDASHQVVPKPSEDEIQEVGLMYLHENADQYKDKWVRFAGKVVNADVERMQLDIEGPSLVNYTYCKMMSDQDVSLYSNGDYVTIVGKMDDKIIGQVMLDTCYVEEEGDASKELEERLSAEFPTSSSSSSLFGTATLDTSSAIEVTAEGVYEELEENQVACKNKYNGKIVKITGIIDNIGTNIYGQEYVSFETGEPYSLDGVQCFFKNDQMDYVASLKKGETITLYGIVEIGSMTFKMGDCSPAE